MPIVEDVGRRWWGCSVVAAAVRGGQAEPGRRAHRVVGGARVARGPAGMGLAAASSRARGGRAVAGSGDGVWEPAAGQGQAADRSSRAAKKEKFGYLGLERSGFAKIGLETLVSLK